MPLKIRWPWGGPRVADVFEYNDKLEDLPPLPPGGLNLRPDPTVIHESRPFPDPDVAYAWFDSEVEDTFEGKIWKKALQQEAKMQLRVYQGKTPSALAGEPDYEADPNVIDLSWIDRLQARLRELGTDLPENSSEFTGLLEYRPVGLDTDDIPTAAIEDPLEDVETHTEDRWMPDYVGAGLGLDVEDPLNPQWSLRHSNHPLAPFPGEPLKWESFVYDDGTTYEGLGRQDAPHGLGVMIFGNGTGAGFKFHDVRRGDKYEGEFQAGWAHGLGMFTSENRGEVYMGEFFAGQRHGCGIKVNMAPFYFFLERGFDPSEAYQRTHQNIMRSIEFRTWYRGKALDSDAEDQEFLMALDEPQGNPYKMMMERERRDMMLRQWMQLKTPADKGAQKLVEILYREVTSSEDDEFQQAEGSAHWYNDVIAPNNFYVEDLIKEIGEGIAPDADELDKYLSPTPMNWRINIGSDMQSYLSEEEQDKIGNAQYEQASMPLWDRNTTMASFWLSKDQAPDIDVKLGTEIYNRVIDDHTSTMQNFEVAYLSAIKNKASEKELQNLENTLRFYYDRGQMRQDLGDTYLSQLMGDAPRTHEQRWTDAMKMRQERNYWWDMLGLEELQPLNRLIRQRPKADEEAYLQKVRSELAQGGDVQYEEDLPFKYGDEGGDGTAALEQLTAKAAEALLRRLTKEELKVLDEDEVLGPDMPYVKPSEYADPADPEEKAFLDRYRRMKDKAAARAARKGEPEEPTDLLALYDVNRNGMMSEDNVEPWYVPPGQIPPSRDHNASIKENVVISPKEALAMYAEDHPNMVDYQSSDLGLVDDVPEDVKDPLLYKRIANRVVDDMKAWARADGNSEEIMADRRNRKSARWEPDPEGDLRYTTDSDVMPLCDLNEILGTIDEVQEIVAKARMYRWKPDGEVTLRFAQDAEGKPIQLMQDPLHYPHNTKWMAPGPLGQVHALPEDPGLRYEMARIANNVSHIYSLYNFDWDPAPGTIQYKIDQRIKKSQELYLRRLNRMVNRAAEQLGEDPVPPLPGSLEDPQLLRPQQPQPPVAPPGAAFASISVGMGRSSIAVMSAFKRALETRPVSMRWPRRELSRTEQQRR